MVPWVTCHLLPALTFLFGFHHCPSGPAENGLPGAGRPAHPGFCAADHSRGGGPALEGARGEARQSLQAADGCLRGPAPGQDRDSGQRGENRWVLVSMGPLGLQIPPEQILLEHLGGIKGIWVCWGNLGVFFSQECACSGWGCVGDGIACLLATQPGSALIFSPLCPITAGHVEASVRFPSHLEQPDG